MYNTAMLKFKEIADEYGCLVPIEANGEIPFEVKRVYYIFGVAEGIRRGFHSHNDLHQALICVKGRVKILVKTPYEEEIVDLNSPSEGLYIGPMIWREMYDFTEDAVLLVLASEHYDENDYVRNYAEYEALAKIYFDR